MFNYFHHNVIRKVTAVFGTLFNNIEIRRFNQGGNVTDSFIVPLRYAPKQKWYNLVFSDNNNNDPDQGNTAMKVPSMGFEMTSMLYDTMRKTNRMNMLRQGNAAQGTQIMGYAPAPYSVEYTLYVFANKTSDWTQIVEQIIPNFNPTFNVPIKLIHNSNTDESMVQDMHITLNSVSPDPNMYGDFRARGTYTWTLNFTLNVSFPGSYDKPEGGIIGADGGASPAILVNFYDETANGNMQVDSGEVPLDTFEID